MQVNFSITVPALPDDDIWFANAAAWTNYWKDVPGIGTVEAVTTTIYTSTPYSAGAGPAYITIDGTPYVLVTTQMFDSLKDRVDALNAAFELMRTQMRDAGLITNAQ